VSSRLFQSSAYSVQANSYIFKYDLAKPSLSVRNEGFQVQLNELISAVRTITTAVATAELSQQASHELGGVGALGDNRASGDFRNDGV